MYKRKTYDQLEFYDDFLFSMIMQKERIAKKVLKTLLDVEIEKIEYISRQHDIKPDYSSQGIRLDVFVKDSDRIFNVEMQATNKPELPLRARYYQSLIDLYSLSGMTDDEGREIPARKQYMHLQESYIIFICKNDPFGFGIPVYTRREICGELAEASEKISDKTRRVWYNASAWQKCEDKDLRAFLRYVSEVKSDSELTDEIDSEVRSSKYNALWRTKFMTDIDMAADWAEEWAQEIAEEKAKVLAEEKAKVLAEEKAKVLAEEKAKVLAEERAKELAEEKMKETARNMLAKGLSVDTISECTGLSLGDVTALQSEVSA